MTKLEAFLQLLAVCQAVFTIGITMVIVFYYLRRSVVTRRFYKINLFMLSSSYLCLMIATTLTLWRSPYHFTDSWYWIVAIGYFLGDLSLITVFKWEIDKATRATAIDEVSKEIEAEIDRLKAHRDTIQGIANPPVKLKDDEPSQNS